jgi:hypothetical protein
LVNRLDGPPVGRLIAGFFDDQTVRLELAGFEIVVVDPVIPDQGIGENDQLAGVAGIRKNLLITGHSGVENDFSGRFSVSAEGLSLVHRTIA